MLPEGSLSSLRWQGLEDYLGEKDQCGVEPFDEIVVTDPRPPRYTIEHNILLFHLYLLLVQIDMKNLA
jgi:hypothetical protein